MASKKVAAKKVAKKPTLAVEKETVLKVDSYALDEFVQKITGHSSDFVCTQECSNDSEHRFVVNGKPDKWDRESYEKHCQGDTPTYSVGHILNCLCADGHIEAGTYLVTVCW